MVETELRDVHVSIHTGACDKAEGMQEALHDTITKDEYVAKPSSFSLVACAWVLEAESLGGRQDRWLIRKTEVLSVPKNMKLLAVPMMELYDRIERYGPQLSAIPHLLSRYNFEFVDENDNVVAVTPGGGPNEGSSSSVPITKVLAGNDDATQHANGNGGDVEMVSGDGALKQEAKDEIL